jgi:hypothetical protein
MLLICTTNLFHAFDCDLFSLLFFLQCFSRTIQFERNIFYKRQRSSAKNTACLWLIVPFGNGTGVKGRIRKQRRERQRRRFTSPTKIASSRVSRSRCLSTHSIRICIARTRTHQLDHHALQASATVTTSTQDRRRASRLEAVVEEATRMKKRKGRL